ncbi:hypothetical protein HYH03_000141 [Edaphochlamys debaryana]|uniref:Uncharacterized protein n=1 Tax=Edaphochlamys debaryana TaxID=47281 RepID=A0A835YH01_9CHLO|nr:hypothetical protein HYH03_000141 [Edaphochlamys debaryana]|eukprot:KAG2501637.1 hypothetical protein HYH03_000141 [Edaphochlamys debaryana]
MQPAEGPGPGAPEGELTALLAQIKELKEGLLENPGASLAAHVEEQLHGESLEDLIAGDERLQYVLSPQAAHDIGSAAATPQRAAATTSEIVESLLENASAMSSGVPATPAQDTATSLLSAEEDLEQYLAKDAAARSAANSHVEHSSGAAVAEAATPAAHSKAAAPGTSSLKRTPTGSRIARPGGIPSSSSARHTNGGASATGMAATRSKPSGSAGAVVTPVGVGAGGGGGSGRSTPRSGSTVTSPTSAAAAAKTAAGASLASGSGAGGGSTRSTPSASASSASMTRKRSQHGAPEGAVPSPAPFRRTPSAATHTTAAGSAAKPTASRTGAVGKGAATKASPVPSTAAAATAASPQPRAAAAGASASSPAPRPAAAPAEAEAEPMECEQSHPSLTLPTVDGHDDLAGESLESMLANDPGLGSYLAATQETSPGVRSLGAGSGASGGNGAGGSSLQRRTSDELLRPLAAAMAGGPADAGLLDEGEDADTAIEALLSARGPREAQDGAGAGAAVAAVVAVTAGVALAEDAQAQAELQGLEGSTAQQVRELLGLSSPGEEAVDGTGRPAPNSEEHWRSVRAEAEALFVDSPGPAAAAATAATAAPEEATSPSRTLDPFAAAAASAFAAAGDVEPEPEPAAGVADEVAVQVAAAEAEAVRGDPPPKRLSEALSRALSMREGPPAHAVSSGLSSDDEQSDGEMLAAEAAAAAVAVAAGGAVAAGAAAAAAGAPSAPAEAGSAGGSDGGAAGSRAYTTQASNASSSGYDAAVAFEANLISRQLAGSFSGASSGGGAPPAGVRISGAGGSLTVPSVAEGDEAAALSSPSHVQAAAAEASAAVAVAAAAVAGATAMEVEDAAATAAAAPAETAAEAAAAEVDAAEVEAEALDVDDVKLEETAVDLPAAAVAAVAAVASAAAGVAVASGAEDEPMFEDAQEDEFEVTGRSAPQQPDAEMAPAAVEATPPVIETAGPNAGAAVPSAAAAPAAAGAAAADSDMAETAAADAAEAEGEGEVAQHHELRHKAPAGAGAAVVAAAGATAAAAAAATLAFSPSEASLAAEPPAKQARLSAAGTASIGDVSPGPSTAAASASGAASMLAAGSTAEQLAEVAAEAQRADTERLASDASHASSQLSAFASIKAAEVAAEAQAVEAAGLTAASASAGASPHGHMADQLPSDTFSLPTDDSAQRSLPALPALSTATTPTPQGAAQRAPADSGDDDSSAPAVAAAAAAVAGAAAAGAGMAAATNSSSSPGSVAPAPVAVPTATPAMAPAPGVVAAMAQGPSSGGLPPRAPGSPARAMGHQSPAAGASPKRLKPPPGPSAPLSIAGAQGAASLPGDRSPVVSTPTATATVAAASAAANTSGAYAAAAPAAAPHGLSCIPPPVPEDGPLLQAWQVLAPTGSVETPDGQSGSQGGRGASLSGPRGSMRSLRSSSSRLSRMSSHREHEEDEDEGDPLRPMRLAREAEAAAAAAAAAAAVMAVDGGGPPGPSPPSATGAVGPLPPSASGSVEAEVRTSPFGAAAAAAAAAARHASAAASMQPSFAKSPSRNTAVGINEDDEELVPAWKMLRTSETGSGAPAGAASPSGDSGSAADRTAAWASSSHALGSRRSLRSMGSHVSQSRLQRATSRASTIPGVLGELDEEDGPAAVPSASAASGRSVTAPGGADGEEALEPAWKVMAGLTPAAAPNEREAAAAARSVPLGSQPSFRTSRTRSSRLVRSTTADGEDLDLGMGAGAGAGAAAVGAGEDGATEDEVDAEIRALRSAPIVPRTRSVTTPGNMNRDTSPTSGTVRFAGVVVGPQPTVSDTGVGPSSGPLAGPPRTSATSYRRSSAYEPGASAPYLVPAVSESGSMAARLAARVSSRRLMGEPLGSVPLPHRSSVGGDPAADAMRPAWQVLPLMSANASVSADSPVNTPSPSGMLASMRSSSRLSRMSSGIPEELLAELRMQAQVAIGHLQVAHSTDPAMPEGMSGDEEPEASRTSLKLPPGSATNVSTSGAGAPAPVEAGADGAGGTLHAWKLLPLRAPAPSSSGLSADVAGSGGTAPVVPSSGGAAATGTGPSPPRMSFGGRPTLGATRAGNMSSRLAVASTKAPALQVSFDTASPAVRPYEPARGEEERTSNPTSASGSGSVPLAAPPPTARGAGPAATGNHPFTEEPVVHAWKMVTPVITPGSTSGGAPAPITPQESSASGGPGASSGPRPPPHGLGSRPSLKSMRSGSLGGSRLSRNSIAVEDYVDDSYTPDGHAPPMVADDVNQAAVSAAAAVAAVAASAAGNAAYPANQASGSRSPGQSPGFASFNERTSAPAAIGGLPPGVLYGSRGPGPARPSGSGGAGPGVASGSSSSGNSNEHLRPPLTRGTTTGSLNVAPASLGAGVDGGEAALARALFARSATRSGRSSASGSRLSRMSSARDSAPGSAPLSGLSGTGAPGTNGSGNPWELGDIREEEAEELRGAASMTGPPPRLSGSGAARPPTVEVPVGQADLLGHAGDDEHLLPAWKVLAEVGDSGLGGSGPSGGETTPGSGKLASTPGSARRSLKSLRSNSLGSSRLSRMTSQVSEQGLEDIVEEGAAAAAAAEGEDEAPEHLSGEGQLSGERISTGRAPPPAPSAGKARIGASLPGSSGGSGISLAAAAGLPQAMMGQPAPAAAPAAAAEPEEPLLPAWKVLGPGGRRSSDGAAGLGAAADPDAPERVSPNAPGSALGVVRASSLRAMRSGSLGNSRLSRVSSMEQQAGSEPAAAAPAPVAVVAASASPSAAAAEVAAAAGFVAPVSPPATSEPASPSGASVRAVAAAAAAAAAGVAAVAGAAGAAGPSSANTPGSGTVSAALSGAVDPQLLRSSIMADSLASNITFANMPDARSDRGSVASVVGPTTHRQGSSGFPSFSAGAQGSASSPTASAGTVGLPPGALLSTGVAAIKEEASPSPQSKSNHAPSPKGAAAAAAAAGVTTADSSPKGALSAGGAVTVGPSPLGAQAAAQPEAAQPAAQQQQQALAELPVAALAPTSKRKGGLFSCFACFGKPAVSE